MTGTRAPRCKLRFECEYRGLCIERIEHGFDHDQIDTTGE
jgi:hypothetical protein